MSCIGVVDVLGCQESAGLRVPRGEFNCQLVILIEVVSERVGHDSQLQEIVQSDVEAEVDVPTITDILTAMVAPPKAPSKPVSIADTGLPYGGAKSVRRVDYLRQEASNSRLGRAGEQFVVNFESARLISLGHERLASEIEHVSQTRGDGDGFDILSFDSDGTERLIEVKTTKYGAQTPFFVTGNELHVSEARSADYHVYRVFSFRKDPKLFSIPGAISKGFQLKPSQFIASVKARG